MKKSILTSIVFIMTTLLYGQHDSIDYDAQDSLKSKPEIKISVAPTENIPLHFQSVLGGPGRKFRPGFSTSVDYLFRCDKKINFGFGLSYQFALVEYTPNMDSGGFTGQTDNISLISFNFTTIYNLKRDYYLSFNPSINLQLNYKSDFITDKQTGLGLSFSLGKQIQLNDKIRLNIEPKIWIHNIIPFRDEHYPLRLTTAGLNLGLVFGHKMNLPPSN
jgi:hypothetical protein